MIVLEIIVRVALVVAVVLIVKNTKLDDILDLFR